MVPQGYPLFAVVKIDENTAGVGAVIGWRTLETVTPGTWPVVQALNAPHVGTATISAKRLLGVFADEMDAARAADRWESDNRPS